MGRSDGYYTFAFCEDMDPGHVLLSCKKRESEISHFLGKGYVLRRIFAASVPSVNRQKIEGYYEQVFRIAA